MMGNTKKFTTDEAREYLVNFMMQHFSDKTFHGYIRAEHAHGKNLAGDFAWQMATALAGCSQETTMHPDALRAALVRLMASDKTIASASDEDLARAKHDPECSPIVKEMAAAVAQARAALAGSAAPVQPGTPAAQWRVDCRPNPPAGHYDGARACLCGGNLTDDELANGAFMNYGQASSFCPFIEWEPKQVGDSPACRGQPVSVIPDHWREKAMDLSRRKDADAGRQAIMLLGILASRTPSVSVEDKRDTERLDFVLSNTAWIQGDSGEFALWTQDEDEEYSILSGIDKTFATPRAAIDAAIASLVKDAS